MKDDVETTLGSRMKDSAMQGIFVGVIIIIISNFMGCASQPSTYTDTSTPAQRNVEATGAAATEAARSNRSTNGDVEMRGVSVSQINLSGLPKYDSRTGRRIIYDQNGNRDHRAELQNIYRTDHQGRQGYLGYTASTFKREADYELKRKINKKIDRIVDKIF